MKNKEHNKCLVLNVDYAPLYLISWKRAVILSMKHVDKKNNGVEIIEFFDDDYIQGTNNQKFLIPAVARILKFRNNGEATIKFNRNNVFIRDGLKCQYCGKCKTVKELTYDHVIPKSQWDYSKSNNPTNWTNIVTSCISCNRKKSNRTPKQAGMTIITTPEKPHKNIKYLPLTHHLSRIGYGIPNEWKIFLGKISLND